MHSSLYMIEKELLEHKVITRLPMLLALCSVLLISGILIGGDAQRSVFFEFNMNGNMDTTQFDIGSTLSSLVHVGAGLISLLLSTLYMPKTLRKERQEGSSMFWRSMPVSHELTHFVKLGVGLIVIPFICSLLVLFANIQLWLFNILGSDSLTPLTQPFDLIYVVSSWLLFLGKMLLITLFLLPLSTIMLALSQLVSAPLLVMFFGSLALRWFTIGVFGIHGVDEFFSQLSSLPIQILVGDDALAAMSQVSLLAMAVYVLLGLVAFKASLQLYRTDSVTWRTLFQR